jgi:glycosyltransferase involved in cell wall biosynthesis
MMQIVNKEPLVSIIITSYNRGKYIEKAIQSCLEQDYNNIEIIISDNHSTDDTDAVVKKYIHDKRIKYFVNDINIGMLPNFKIATEERTNGKYLTYLSSDDYFCNEKFISTAVALINKYNDIVLVVAKNATLFEDSNEVKEDNTSSFFQQESVEGDYMFKQFPKCFFPGWGAVLMDRDKLLKTDLFDSKAQSLDYEGNLKLMLQGNIAFIKEPSYVWRKHNSNASGFLTYQVQKDSFDFIDNTCIFAKKTDTPITRKVDIDKWKIEAYYANLNGIVRRLVNRKDELKKIMDFVKTEKKIQVSFFKSPKYFLLFKIYANYGILKPLLKIFYPQLYRSLEREAQ